MHDDVPRKSQRATRKGRERRDKILEVASEVFRENGFEATSMSQIAALAGGSKGTLYNYFPSKASLLAAVVEKIWEGIFHKDRMPRQPEGFLANVRWLFERLHSGSEQFPDFFTAHAAGFSSGEAGKGREVMNSYFGHIKRGLIKSLSNDPCVRADAFDDVFTPAALAEFVFDSLLALFVRNAPDCETLLALIQRAVY